MRLGEKLKALRLERGMSIHELSRRSGVSKSLLSQIERGASVPTVTKLLQIARAFDLPMSSMLPDDEARGEVGLLKRRDAPNPNRMTVVRKGGRKKLLLPWGARYEMLCPDLRHRIEFIYLRYPVGTKAEDFYSHDGEECGVVLEGSYRGTIGDETVVLEPGDSIYYDSSIPHRWENAGDTEVRAIWAITPPSF